MVGCALPEVKDQRDHERAGRCEPYDEARRFAALLGDRGRGVHASDQEREDPMSRGNGDVQDGQRDGPERDLHDERIDHEAPDRARKYPCHSRNDNEETERVVRSEQWMKRRQHRALGSTQAGTRPFRGGA